VRSQSATHDVDERREPPARPAPRQEPRPEPRPEPVRQEAPRQEPRRQEPARVEPQPQQQREYARPEPAPAPRLEPVRAEVRPAAPAYQPAARLEPAPQRAAVEPREPAPREAAPAPQSASPFAAQVNPPAPAKAEDGGWLRDVLRNATAKQASNQPAAPQPQQGNLSGLTEEIARAIDLTALAEAWTRYQAGESNVFSRRIYTLGGQGTYDEVRKKLQRDPEFARTSQAYMAEFEQLLKRAAAGPRPAQESREYLLSDRGKVYTMLAHASGRLN
jgi:hypothetical protein